MSIYGDIKVKQFLYRPLGLQEVAASRFLDCQHMKVLRLSVLHTGCLYPWEMSLILLTV